MNKEDVQARIAAIQAEMAQLKANYAKLEGHLGECIHWLAQIAKTEEAEKENGEVNGENAGEVA